MHSAVRAARDALRAEFARIAALPRVAAVRITKNKLTVYTKPLVVTATDRSRWDIGEWRITIPRAREPESYWSACQYDIRVRPLCKPRKVINGFVHMHVYENERVCWGSAGQTVDDALDRAEYFAAVILIIKVLYEGYVYDFRHDTDGYAYRLAALGRELLPWEDPQPVRRGIPAAPYLARQAMTYVSWCDRRVQDAARNRVDDLWWL